MKPTARCSRPRKGGREGPPAPQQTGPRRGLQEHPEGRLPRAAGADTLASPGAAAHRLADVSRIPGPAVDDAHVPRAQ